jgi:hypothetical protein
LRHHRRKPMIPLGTERNHRRSVAPVTLSQPATETEPPP